jgi:hypothetical protein
VPWLMPHNFRHEGVQKTVDRYSIRQTCRLQGKSFFKFLFSGETDLEHFDARTRKR